MQSVTVLGAKGRFGRAAVAAFVQAGWGVTAFGRGLDAASFADVKIVQGDARESAVVTQACTGADVIIYAINPPYAAWAAEVPKLSQSVIAAARATGATVLIPGNIYNYGAGMPPVLNEQTRWQPTTRKGHLRVEMEEAFRVGVIARFVR